MKDVSIKLSTLLTILTIVGALTTGGIVFGELRGGLVEQGRRLDATETRMAAMYEQTEEINQKITEVATDLRWIRVLIEEYAKKVHSMEDQTKSNNMRGEG